MAAWSLLLQNLEHALNIKTIGDGGENCPLPAAVLEIEDGADIFIPPDISQLLSIDENKDAEKADGVAFAVVIVGHHLKNILLFTVTTNALDWSMVQA